MELKVTIEITPEGICLTDAPDDLTAALMILAWGTHAVVKQANDRTKGRIVSLPGRDVPHGLGG